MKIDHAVLAVADLNDAAQRLRARTGLASIPGGRHPAWGTENRIVPLGDDYVELLAVVDRPSGRRRRWDARSSTSRGTARIDGSRCAWRHPNRCHRRAARAHRGGGGAHAPDGDPVRWRGAGIEDARRPFWLPFFIEWDVPPAQHPGRAGAEHRVAPRASAARRWRATRSAWDAWLDGAEVPMSVVEADEVPRGVRSVTVGLADGGEVVV